MYKSDKILALADAWKCLNFHNKERVDVLRVIFSRNHGVFTANSTLHGRRLIKLERLMAVQAEMSSTKKPLQLPINRIKTIMKSSPNVETIGQEALFAVTKSADLFIKFMAEEGLRKCLLKEKLEYKGIAEVAQTNGNLNFLTEILPRKLTVEECKLITKQDREKSDSDSSDESSDDVN